MIYLYILKSNTILTVNVFVNILCGQNASDVISPSKNGNFEFEPPQKSHLSFTLLVMFLRCVTQI